MDMNADIIDEKLNKKIENYIYWSLHILIIGAIVSLWIFLLRHDLHCLFQQKLYGRIIFDIFSICFFSVLMAPFFRILVVILFPFTYILKVNKSLEIMLK